MTWGPASQHHTTRKGWNMAVAALSASAIVFTAVRLGPWNPDSGYWTSGIGVLLLWPGMVVSVALTVVLRPGAHEMPGSFAVMLVTTWVTYFALAYAWLRRTSGKQSADPRTPSSSPGAGSHDT
jgi:hypothetical protein